MNIAKMRKRGFVWLFLGVLLYLGGILIMERPFVLRGTNIPFGLILLGVGAAILGWDYVQYRKESTSQGNPEG